MHVFPSISFHVIAIEVLIRPGSAPTHCRGAVLIDAIVRTGPFVAVGVVDRDK
jgi:hypothetical protein